MADIKEYFDRTKYPAKKPHSHRMIVEETKDIEEKTEKYIKYSVELTGRLKVIDYWYDHMNAKRTEVVVII